MKRNQKIHIYRSKSIGRPIMESMYRYSIHGNVLPLQNKGIARGISPLRTNHIHRQCTHRHKGSPIPNMRNPLLPLLSRNKSVNVHDISSISSFQQLPMINSRNSVCDSLVVNPIHKKCRILIDRSKIDENAQRQCEVDSAIGNKQGHKLLIPIKLNQTIDDDDDPNFITKIDWLVYLKPIQHNNHLCSVSYRKYFV
jgi:hypothetical protein